MRGYEPQNDAGDVTMDFRIVLHSHTNSVARLRVNAPHCANAPTAEMAWVRTDGRKIADDPALLQQGRTDIAACNANLDTGSPTDGARGCMAQKGYVLVRRDQAEDVRASYATGAQQQGAPDR